MERRFALSLKRLALVQVVADSSRKLVENASIPPRVKEERQRIAKKKKSEIGFCGVERRGTTTIVTIGIRNRRQFNLAERTVFAGGRYFWSEIIAARTKLLAAISTAYQYAGCAKRRRLSVLSVPYSTAPAIRSRSLSLSLFLSPSPLSLLPLLCSPFSHLLSSLYSLPYSDNDRLSLKFPEGCPRGADKTGIERPMIGRSDKKHGV